MRRPIDYMKIAKAIEFYKARNYHYIEVPWLVSEASINITKPPKARPFETFMGQLVASGEQSFLEIAADLCPSRKHMCATPCFRDEEYDELHLPYFLKVELFVLLWKDDTYEKPLKDMIADATAFFHQYTSKVKMVRTDIGIDLMLNDIEIGSYGYREVNGLRWVYGTGIAEPRFTQAFHEGITTIT